MAFVSSCELSREPQAIVVHCCDFRFQAGLREFLDSGLGLAGEYDAMVLPGGPWCLKPFDALPKFHWAARKWFNTMVKLHALRRAVLIAHQDCGWYKWLASYQPQNDDPRRIQEEDLRLAHYTITRDFAGLNVDLYYAGWSADSRVQVAPVPLREGELVH